MKNLLFILLLISLNVVGQVYQPVTYNYNGTPTNGVKIKTNLPFSPGSYMPTIILEGYNFGSSETINLMINYYIYSDASTTANWENPANFYFLTTNASSAGGYAPTIKLANENSKVVIYIDSKDYYQRFMVRAFGQGMSEQSAWFQGWTTADEPLTGTKQVTVPYKNRVKGEFIVNGYTTFNGNNFYENQNTIYAKNTSGTYEAVLYPRWTNNATYLDGGSGGLYLRVNSGNNESLHINAQGNVGIGTSVPGTFKLAVNGNIKAKEVKVSTLNWADFVFANEYQLPELSEVEKFIKANKRLPEIPSEKEVKENGIELGEMNAKLLQKVEELTLYLIELKKENDTQSKQINELISIIKK